MSGIRRLRAGRGTSSWLAWSSWLASLRSRPAAAARAVAAPVQLSPPRRNAAARWSSPSRVSRRRSTRRSTLRVNGWAMEHAIFGNLLNYSSGPGAAGTKIIADMATEVPSVANGGIIERRQDLHLPYPAGHQVRAAGQPRGHGAGLRLQLPAHDEPAHGAGQGLLRRHRRPAGLPQRQGQDHHRLQGDRQVHPRGRPREADRHLPQHHGDALQRAGGQGVGRQVGQAGRPAPAGHRAVHARPLGGKPGPSSDAQPQLHRHGGLRRRHALRVLDHTDDRRAQGAERRRRPARRLHPAGQLPGPDRQSRSGRARWWSSRPSRSTTCS